MRKDTSDVCLERVVDTSDLPPSEVERINNSWCPINIGKPRSQCSILASTLRDHCLSQQKATNTSSHRVSTVLMLLVSLPSVHLELLMPSSTCVFTLLCAFVARWIQHIDLLHLRHVFRGISVYYLEAAILV